MKNFLNQSVIEIDREKYLGLLMILAPLLNFLSGITFDLHAPSLPAIAIYFSAPISAAKNTITVALLGLALGCLVFGALLDIFGRRRIILLGLVIYTIASFSALASSSMQQLLWLRFVQGFAVSALSIGCRTIVIDSFTGHDFKVAMLYTSLAFGLGPIIAPFIGGVLQHYYGWQANFIGYGLVSLALFVMVFLFVTESKKNDQAFSLQHLLAGYFTILKNKVFVPGILVMGFSQVLLIAYTVTGAFLVENVLHHSAITYGNTALIISCGYLLGTLINRMLLKFFSIPLLINIGFVILVVGLVMQTLFALMTPLNLFTLVLPILIIGLSQGFVFINTFTACLTQFSHAAGISTALFTASLMMITTIGTNMISHFSIVNLEHLAWLFIVPAVLQLIVFFCFFKKMVQK